MKSRFWISILFVCSTPTWAQLTDRTQAPNNAKAGIAKSLQDETGAGRGDVNTWGWPVAPGFPQFGHGSIKLTVLFNDPTDPE